MRKFLKQLRKGLQTACVTAALATCWQIGQPANASATIETVRFSGIISPTTHDLSHVYLIYGTGYSSIYGDLHSVKLADLMVGGQDNSFSVLADVEDETSLWGYVAALHGNVSGGQYIENTNGVALGIAATEGNSWEQSYSYSMDESTAFGHLLNDNPELLPDFYWGWDGWDWNYGNGIEINESKNLYTFSSASHAGEIHIQSEIVPEPITLLLFGSGGLVILRRKKPKE